MGARENIIKVAKSYMGAVGGSTLHADIIHIFNTVKPCGYTAKKTDPWCAEFASACAIQAFGKKDAKAYFPLTASCPKMVTIAKDMGIWVENDAYKPGIGDFILYDWEDTKDGSGDNKNSPNHVGIVEKVSGTEITVIEGNKGNKVARRKIKVNGKYIRGYACPRYEKIKVDKVPTKPIDDVVKEVLEGKWGTWTERKKALTNAGYDYAVVQKRVTQVVKLTDDVLAGKYGTGEERKKKLGSDYDIVQWNINRIYAERK